MKIELVKNSVAEYGHFVELKRATSMDWENIEKVLVTEHEWTVNGAACLVRLVREYGSFILGNAYALSRALDIEDGELGF